MSFAAVLTGSPSGPSFGTDAGGDDARSISERIADALTLWESDTPQNLPTSFSVGMDELHEAFSESREPDWDGEGAHPASPLSKLFAKRLLAVLPSNIPPPMIVFSHGGDAVFEWALGHRRRLTISVSGSGEVRYARTLNADQRARVDTFSGTELPDELAETLIGFF